MQRVELNAVDAALYCPFCGHQVVAASEGDDAAGYSGPCEHTLFVATDDGFEYRSERFNAASGLPNDLETSELPDGGIDAITDDVAVRDAVKFALYMPAPSQFGFYCGFSRESAE